MIPGKSFDIKLEGFKELHDILLTMPEKLAQRALKNSVSAGMRVIRNQAAANVGQPTSSLAISTKLAKKTAWYCKCYMGPNTDKWYLMFKELGTYWKRERGRGPTVGNVGKKGKIIVGQRKTPWLGPAFDRKYGECLEKIKEKLGAQIEKLWLSKQ